MQDLRSYQEQAIHDLRIAIRHGYKRIVLHAPCGAGKTTIFSAISHLAAPRHVLFVVHRRELVYQAHARVGDAGIIMASDKLTDPEKRVQIASVQTITRRKCRPPADIIFLDECHHATAKSWKSLIDSYPDTPIVGLTATPQHLGGIFEKIIPVASYAELFSCGYLVNPRYFGPTVPDLRAVKIRKGDYEEKALGEVMGTPRLVGSIIEHWHDKAEGEPTAVYAVSVSHSKQIVDRFLAEGVPAAHIDWSTPKAERDQILRDLAKGELTVISNVGILTEGYDLPALNCAIFARPTKSIVLAYQMAGRVLRPGGKRPVILDHAGICLEHGLPYEDREFALNKKRSEKQPAINPVKICRLCFGVVPRVAVVCNHCGGDLSSPAAVIEETPHKLKEIKQTKPRVPKWDKLRAQNCIRCGHRALARGLGAYVRWCKCLRCGYSRMWTLDGRGADLEEQRQTFDLLCSYGSGKGYPASWATKQFERIFGGEPPKDPAHNNTPGDHFEERSLHA